MRKKIAYCDICNRELGEEEKEYFLYLFEERVPDAAGGMENIYADADLCPRHLIEFIHFYIKQQGKDTLDRIPCTSGSYLKHYIKEYKQIDMKRG